MKRLREEETGIVDGSGNEDDDADADAWEGWDVETDSGSDSGSEGWIGVESDGDDLELSDSEDETLGKPTATQQEGQNRVSTLATTKVCDASRAVSIDFYLRSFRF